MRHFLFILFLSCFSAVTSQTTTRLKKTIPIETENFVGSDYDFNYYYFSKTVLSKKTPRETLNYSSFLYGNISSVDITNPLKIVVYYRDFNVVTLLDSQLNETDIIQLPYDVSFATKGTANHLWLFTTNTQVIENYNFKTNSVDSKSQPLKNTSVLNMKSTENYVYLHTSTGIQTFDYLGNFIKEDKNRTIEDFQYNNRVLYTLSEDTIYQSKDTISPITFPEISNIKNFFSINNHFFIFDSAQLYLFSTEKK
jgi:hypothetical protein